MDSRAPFTYDGAVRTFLAMVGIALIVAVLVLATLELVFDLVMAYYSP